MKLGHAREKSIQTMAKQGLLKGVKTCKMYLCEHCVLSKRTKVMFGTVIQRTKGILDYVHTDTWSPSKNVSIGEKYYFVSFVDDYSRRNWMYTMSQKERSPRYLCGVEMENEVADMQEDQDTQLR